MSVKSIIQNSCTKTRNMEEGESKTLHGVKLTLVLKSAERYIFKAEKHVTSFWSCTPCWRTDLDATGPKYWINVQEVTEDFKPVEKLTDQEVDLGPKDIVLKYLMDFKDYKTISGYSISNVWDDENKSAYRFEKDGKIEFWQISRYEVYQVKSAEKTINIWEKL